MLINLGAQLQSLSTAYVRLDCDALGLDCTQLTYAGGRTVRTSCPQINWTAAPTADGVLLQASEPIEIPAASGGYCAVWFDVE